MMRRLSLSTLTILFSLAATVFGETCYFPDGSVDTSGIPCPKVGTNDVVACCRRSNHYCLTNGLCLETNAWTMYRNSCTDKNFRASGCPVVCRDNARGSHSGVNYCFDNAIWTCKGRSDCAKGNFTMPSPKGRIVINAAVQADMGIAAVTTGTGASGTSTAVCSSAESAAGGGISASAAAGIGVGVGVSLAIAVGALTVLLLREKKKTKAVGSAYHGRSHRHGGSVASPMGAKQEYPAGFIHTSLPTGHGWPAPMTELPPDSTVRHELSQ